MNGLRERAGWWSRPNAKLTAVDDELMWYFRDARARYQVIVTD